MAKKTKISKDPFSNFVFPTEEQIYKDTMRERNKLQANDPAWKEAQRKGAIEKYKNDPAYNLKRSASLRKTKGKTLITPYGEFSGPAEFNDLGVTKCKHSDQMRIKPHLYYYKEDGPGDPTYETVFVTPYGEYLAGHVSANGSWKQKAYDDAMLNKDELTHPYTNKNAADWIVRVLRSHNNLYFKEQRVKIEWPLKVDV